MSGRPSTDIDANDRLTETGLSPPQAAANLWFDFNGRGEAIFRVLTRV